MKSYFYCLLFFIAGLSLTAKAQKETIRTYYEHINRAELAIIDTNYKASQKEYVAAFELKYPNGKDLYNAFVVSYYLQDTSSATRFYNWLAFHGLPRGYFADSMSNLPFYEIVTAMHDSSYQAGYEVLDKGAVDFWDIVYEFTTKYRRMEVNGAQVEHMIIEGQKKADKNAEMDQLNTENILGYMSSGGKYSFKDVGFWTRGSSPHTENYPFYYHMWQSGGSPDLDSFYTNACKAGTIDMGNLISLFYNRGGFDRVTKKIKQYGLDGDFREYSIEEMKSININRSELYLSTISDFKRIRTYDVDHRPNSGIWERNMFLFITGMW